MGAVRQRNVALILARELAVNVATPMWIWDEEGELVYYNEHVQAIVGSPEREIDVVRLDELPQFDPRDLDGNPIDVSELPSAIALNQRIPAHREFRITGLDGAKRRIAVTAYPLFGRGNEFCGAVSVFWQLEDGD